MNHFIYRLGLCLIFFLRFTLCAIDDTVLSDSWDDCEAFHADFSTSDDMLNEVLHEPDQSDDFASVMQTEILDESHLITTSPILINEFNEWEDFTREMPYEVPEETLVNTTNPHHPQPSNQCESSSPLLIDDSNQWEELIREMQYEVPEKTLIDTTIPHHPQPSNQREFTSTLLTNDSHEWEESRTELRNDTEMISVHAREPKYRNLPHRQFVTVGGRSRTGYKIVVIFHNVIPGKSNRHNLSLEQLELEFISHKKKPQWEELKQYSLKKYKSYWGNVCDYFWKKPKPDDVRFRGCWVRMAYFPYSHVTAVLTHISDVDKPRKLDVLQCTCHYYVKYQREPDSDQTDFAIHKHGDNEYFVLDKIHDKRYSYKIVDLLTEVYLPDPVN